MDMGSVLGNTLRTKLARGPLCPLETLIMTIAQRKEPEGMFNFLVPTVNPKPQMTFTFYTISNIDLIYC